MQIQEKEKPYKGTHLRIHTHHFLSTHYLKEAQSKKISKSTHFNVLNYYLQLRELLGSSETEIRFDEIMRVSVTQKCYPKSKGLLLLGE